LDANTKTLRLGEPFDTLWTQTLAFLKGQMTKGTFSHFVGSYVVSFDGGTYRIAMKNEQSKEWAAFRMQRIVERALSVAAGGPARVEFVVAERNGSSAPPASTLAVETSPAEAEAVSAGGEPTPVEEDEAFDFANIDYQKFFFNQSGFLPVVHYHSTFWQAYLNQFNSKAFGLWQCLQQFDRRSVFRSEMAHWWTPPKKVSIRELAGVLGCSRTTLTGRLVPCWWYENSKREGAPMEVCCGRHHPSRWEPSDAEGMDRQCKHWKVGAIEVLQEMGILIAQVNQEACPPRSKSFRFQVWRLLPLLTPAQVETLPLIVQLRHEQWLERYSHLAGFSPEMWETIEDDSLVRLQAGYDRGRTLENNYRPNPFSYL